jgi:hypothetical protein
MIAKSLSEAKKLGHTTYNTGKPCQYEREKRKRLYSLNPEKFRKIRKDSYHQNIDLERQKAVLRSAEWRSKNNEHHHTRVLKSAHRVIKRAQQFNCLPKWLTKDDYWMMEEAYDLAKIRTKMFGFQWDVDHILPLNGKNVKGFHCPLNLKVVPHRENIRKSNHYIPV